MSSVVCEFQAVMPDIQSAMNISGAQNGIRIKLDIAESDFAEGIKLALVRGKVFKVTVEEVEE